MSVALTGDLVADARAAGRGIAAFNVITLEHAEAIVAGAEEAARPVILQVSENAVTFHGGRLAPLAAALHALVVSSSVPLALHLDHITQLSLAEQAVECGFSSVMFDAGALPYAENVAATGHAVKWAHANGIWLEAELGYVGGKPDAPQTAHAPGVRTDPVEAREYVRATGVDALAVAVGTSHAMTSRTAELDHDLIARLKDAVGVPLVLHGSSGVSDENLKRAVEHGMTKVNIGTALNIAFTGAVRAHLARNSTQVDPRRYLAGAREAMVRVVRQATETLGCPDVASGEPDVASGE
ncbi:class II fructose-bisphosphate aldolase family protein [Planosporangium thailandense]|uniref:Class II fructose-bisphosphate aldolase family protein n=1 Tax=Planosporangium thailandense TaxID=765197 RepID=A0ABX0XVK5_9ACTN|nr:class II fructose-bisphosphate aldolase [Planosporangium thailandense]NJC69229.1 class II fructose-bisphosphate aldolase family protein [Planosporangium thailandense]